MHLHIVFNIPIVDLKSSDIYLVFTFTVFTSIHLYFQQDAGLRMTSSWVVESLNYLWFVYTTQLSTIFSTKLFV